MVANTLDDNGLPVLIDTKGKLTSEDTWYSWWNVDPNWNIELQTTLTAIWDPTAKAYTFNNPEYFPIDGQGWDELEPRDYYHNFGFCLTLRNQFTYQPGQVFSFTGDDDVWVFIDRKLALDLGGPHPPMSGEIRVDTLGLTEGYTYSFDFFYCERHTHGSSLKFSTSIKLDPCGLLDEDEDGTGDICDYCPFGNPDLGLSVKGSGLSQTFTVSLGAEVRDGLELSLDFGDGHSTEIYTAIQTMIVHTYDKPGTYTAKVTSTELAGCASSSDSVEVTLTTEGTRIAPKCSSIPLMPGQNGGLQRRK
jgi:fibro-slime domain-containing protein